MVYEAMNLADFHNLHRGETCVIVGVGPNLHLTPPQWFNYPSFGVNTLYRYEGWEPTYYVGVDERLRLEDGTAIVERYPDVPKFFPSPDWDDLQGPNIYRFMHRQGGNLFMGGQPVNDVKALTHWGITYRRIMDAAFQIAFWMGFRTMLMIGVQHKPGTRKQLFWGTDAGELQDDFYFEELGYTECRRMMGNVRVLNISEDTYVPDDVLPRGDWREWKNN